MKYKQFCFIFLIISMIVIVSGTLFLPGVVMEVFAWTAIKEELAYKITEVFLGILLLVLSSNRFYEAIRNNCNRKLNRSGKKNVRLLLSIKIVNDIIAAFPKKTVLFGIYMFLVMAQYFGLIRNICNFGFIVIFFMAVDKIITAWDIEKNVFREHSGKAYRRTVNIQTARQNSD